MKTKKNWNKYIFEGLLIIFSVLFALIINSTFQSYETYKKKNIALNGILYEIKKNKQILNGWNSRHKEINTHLENLDTSINKPIDNQNTVDITYYIGNGSIINEFLDDSAWEAAKSSGIISEFDFELTQALSKTYKQQSYIQNGTMEKILDELLNIDSYDEDNYMKTKIQLQLLFRELLGQEISLNTYYKEDEKLLE